MVIKPLFGSLLFNLVKNDPINDLMKAQNRITALYKIYKIVFFLNPPGFESTHAVSH